MADLAVTIVAHIVLGVGLLIAARAAYHAVAPRCCQCGARHITGQTGCADYTDERRTGHGRPPH